MGLPLLAAGVLQAQIPAPDDAPKPRSPEETAASFRLPDGFRLEVAASEPLIAAPSGICWDERGRMFVSELHGYNLAGQLDIEELNRTGRLDTEVRRVQADPKFREAAQAGTFGVIKRLEDTNGDGRMDIAKVWAADLPPAYGLVPARGGLIAACAPHIIYFADRDGDDVAETREILFTGFPTGELERGINAPQWGADGWIYFGRGWGGGTISGPRLSAPVQLPGTDFRIRADGSAIEPVTGSTHTFGFAMNDAGDRFTVTTTRPGIFVAPLPWRYLARNPDLAAAPPDLPSGDRRAYAISQPHPWRQKRADHPAYFEFYKSRYGAAESEAGGWFTAACGPMIYQDPVLPGLRGQYFVCEPAGNLIHRAVIRPDGPGLRLERPPGEERSEFAASTDGWSHPMHLAHGPDGSIWITDYYREIIEDYSAIPRHLQQQYGLSAGHDRGRIYRLTHRAAPAAPAADMARLDGPALVNECASPLLWRRMTAQRLLRERGAPGIAPLLRRALAAPGEPSAIITLLFALEQAGALVPADVQPFLAHPDPAVRIRALQLADRWFSAETGRGLAEAVLAGAATETDPRVLIQFALSLGETPDPRALGLLARFARERLEIRWLDTAILSSVHGRGADLLSLLLREAGAPPSFLAALSQTIAARRDEAGLARTFQLIRTAGGPAQAAVLNGLAAGRKNAPRQPLTDLAAREALAALAASEVPEVREAAQTLAATFLPSAPADRPSPGLARIPADPPVTDETFRQFVVALEGARNLERGRELFLAACATCHRVGGLGTDLGPDLLGQAGMPEESLLRELLVPGERIRPGYETTEVQTREGGPILGILKNEGAASVTLAQAGGAEQTILRKDIVAMRRLEGSLMPSFARTLTPAEAADLLAWLRGNLRTGLPAPPAASPSK